MARVNTVGLEELAKELAQRAVGDKDRVRKMLKTGAEIIIDETKLAAYKHSLYLTGEMIASISWGNMQINPDSAKVEIWPKGTRQNGRRRERNAVVGFVQHYGRSYGRKKRAGTQFFDEGLENAAENASKKMADIWHDTK